MVKLTYQVITVNFFLKPERLMNTLKTGVYMWKAGLKTA